MDLFGEVAFVFDIVIALLLVVTIGYAVLLSRKLNTLRESRAGMERLLADFGAAIERTEAGLATLRASAEESGEALRDRIEKADRLADDLAFLHKRADLAVNRLEGSLERSRGASRNDPVAEPRRTASAPNGDPRAANSDERAFHNPWRDMGPRSGDPAAGVAAAETSPVVSDDEFGPRGGPDRRTTERLDDQSQLLKVLEGMR